MKNKYVQLESEVLLTDLDYITMFHPERSVYCTLIFYLTSNNGKCEYKSSALSKLCHCESIEEFEQIWQNISKKFQTRNNVIKHKRVTKELRRAKKFIQHQRKAGLASARKRQQQLNRGSTGVTSQFQPTKTKKNVNEKEKKVNTNTFTKEQSFSSLNSLRALSFNKALISIIKPRNQSDRTCFRNITNWPVTGCATGRFNEEIFDRILGYAREAGTGRNPAAFITLLKKELGYRPARKASV